jgi:hypothetical protein
MSASTLRSPCEKKFSLDVEICRDMLERSVDPLVEKAIPTRSHKAPAQWASSVSWMINANAREVVGRQGRAETWRRSEEIRSIRSLVFALLIGDPVV